MANQSITSILALRNHQHQLFLAEGEHRSWDWEVIEDEDLYADVESLQSFSISSGDEDDDGHQSESEGVDADPDHFYAQRDDFQVAVGVYLDLTPSEPHRRQLNHGSEFGEVAFYSGADDVIGEATDRDLVPSVDPLGFHVPNSANPLNDGPHGDEDGVLREPKAPPSCNSVTLFRSGGNVVDVYDDDDDVGYEVDVDDELVPWGVANRLEKQRMRKLGKRTFARMNKSKKMAHFYTTPACVHGKHGLGLKPY